MEDEKISAQLESNQKLIRSYCDDGAEMRMCQSTRVAGCSYAEATEGGNK